MIALHMFESFHIFIIMFHYTHFKHIMSNCSSPHYYRFECVCLYESFVWAAYVFLLILLFYPFVLRFVLHVCFLFVFIFAWTHTQYHHHTFITTYYFSHVSPYLRNPLYIPFILVTIHKLHNVTIHDLTISWTLNSPSTHHQRAFRFGFCFLLGKVLHANQRQNTRTHTVYILVQRHHPGDCKHFPPFSSANRVFAVQDLTVILHQAWRLPRCPFIVSRIRRPARAIRTGAISPHVTVSNQHHPTACRRYSSSSRMRLPDDRSRS